MSIDKKLIKWVVLSILLGAVGSGVWEYMLKPIALGGTNVLLDIATLGIKQFKDSLYESIAEGFHETASLGLLTFLFGFLPSFLLGMATAAVTTIPLFSRVLKPEVDAEKRKRVDRIMISVAVTMMVFLLAYSIVYVSRVTYVNGAVTHFNQLMVIAAPYLTEEDRIKQNSLFAQIRNRDDYMRVVSYLSDVCVKNKQVTPEFSIW